MSDPANEDGRAGSADRALSASPTEPLRVSTLSGHDPSRGTCPTCGGESRFEGRCAACIMADFDDDFDDQCYECGGEGFVSSCFSEYACLYPEDGCDLCTRRCDVCSPQRRDSDGSGEAGETRSGSTEGDSAGAQHIAQPGDAS